MGKKRRIVFFMLMVLKNGWIDFVLILVVTLVSQIKFILIFCETEQEYILETDVPNVTEQNVVIKRWRQA